MKLQEWLEHISLQHSKAIDMGLDRMREMVGRLDLENPAEQVVTVAGTNGKGSTVIAMESLLLSAGMAVLSSISPHVKRFNERIRINGEEASDLDICSAFQSIDEARLLDREIPLTYFEYAALASLYLAKMKQVNVAIFEIGLGGRLDAFNVIDAHTAVITSIGYDHMEFLGNNLESIGREKAGILRPEQRVVLGPDMPESVIECCHKLDLSPRIYGKDFVADSSGVSQCWNLNADDYHVTDIPLTNLAPQNVAIAFETAKTITAIKHDCLKKSSLIRHFPGRLEPVEYSGRKFVLDVAHNPQGVEFLLTQLKLRSYQVGAVVCGMLANKEHSAVWQKMEALHELPWFIVSTEGERSYPNNLLLEHFSDSCTPVDTIEKAVSSAVKETGSMGIVLVFGSFNIVERVGEYLAG